MNGTTHSKEYYNPDRDNFSQWFNALTEPQKQQLRDKARWEHMTLLAVAKEWGVDIPNSLLSQIHRPTLAKGWDKNGNSCWRVFCDICSDERLQYTYKCSVHATSSWWPPEYLYES